MLPRKLTAVLQPGHGLRTQGPGCKSQPLNLVAVGYWALCLTFLIIKRVINIESTS